MNDSLLALRETQIRFGVPETMVRLDLGPDALSRARAVIASSRLLPAEDQLRLVIAQEFLVESFRRADVCFAGHLITRIDDSPPRLSIAHLIVSVRRVRHGGAEVFGVLASQLAATDRSRQVGFADLPAGRAMLVIEDHVLLPGSDVFDVFARATKRKQRVRQGHLILGTPERGGFVTFTLATPCGQDWAGYAAVLAAIGDTISFVPHGPRSTAPAGRIAAALDPDGGQCRGSPAGA